ncbi:DMT family transporter [Algirhabdus cladophorae]|uniref:DMT family transporter n=1 Tax=Algirhabdus cladophorae TaxID=3377108 RepID=UPI003B846398
MSQTDRPLLGIALMLGFCLMAPLGDAMAKILGTSISVAQILLVRFAVQGIVLVPICWITGRSLRLAPRVHRLAWVRVVLHVVGIGAMFTALIYLPLAEAIAIAFVMPFILLLMGKVFLNEDVGIRRLAACGVGFIGTLFVIQPSFAEVGAFAMLPLVVAVVFALFMVVTRSIAKEVDPIALQGLNGFMALAILVPLLLWGHSSGIAGASWRAPDMASWTLLIAVGVLGTIAHLFMTWSLRFAPSTTLAPMQYLEIPFATIIGWLVFQDLPNGLAAVGIAITMAAGLYVILRERQTNAVQP